MQPTSPQNTKITYDEKRGRFIIASPPWDIERARGLPNRRWHKATRTWHAPAIRANALYMTDAYRHGVAAHWEANALAKLAEVMLHKPSARPNLFPPTYVFKTQPRKAQRAALDKTYGLHASALFMDMRTGKTKTVIDWAAAARIEAKIGAMVIICPLSIRKNWVREFKIHSPIDVDVHLLDTKDKGKAFEKWLHTRSDFKCLLVGVESMAAGSAASYVERYCLAMPKILAVVDESSKIKNPSAARTKAVIKIGRMVEFRTVMTGTPIAQGPLDLYAQFEFLDPDIIGMGDMYAFRNRYAVMGGFENRQEIGYQNLDELMEIIAPFVYQVRQHEVIDIPDKIMVTREVELSPEQARLYKQMKKDKKIVTDNKTLLAQNVLERMLRLQEIAGGLVSYAYEPEQIEAMMARTGKKNVPKFYRERIEGKNPKLDDLIEATEDYPGQTIVWAVYKEEIRMIADALRAKYGDDQVVEIHGDVNEHDRDVNVNVKFQGKQCRFIVGNAATGGMGLTMSVAENIFYFSNSFNFIDREQSIERGTGEGKTKGVICVDFIARGTVDEVSCAALVDKKNVSEYVRGEIDRKGARAVDALLGDL